MKDQTDRAESRLGNLNSVAIGNVGKVAEDGVVHGLRQEPHGAVAEAELSSTRVKAVEDPGVRSLQRVWRSTTRAGPNAVDVPIFLVVAHVGLSGCHQSRAT